MAKPYHNAEGYSDPTAYQALKNIDDEKKAKELLRVLAYIVRNSGFELTRKIELRDQKSGKIYR